MKSYQYALSITSQFYFCGIPFRLDSSPKCSLNCSYCYAMALGGRNTTPHQYANPISLRRKLESLTHPHSTNITKEFLIQEIPIHFGGMSDPFADVHCTNISLELLDILNEFNYPIVISTKNTSFLLHDDVLKILCSMKKVIIQISISTIFDRFSSYIEPNSPLPSNRLKTISEITKMGIPVFARIQPFFAWRINEICNEMIPALSACGVSHIIVEFLKLPIEKSGDPIKLISETCNFDIENFYRIHEAKIMSREWLLPARIKWELLQPVINTIHKYRLTYGSADYGLNHLGDTDCCCGVDKIRGFSNYYKGNFSFFLRKSVNNSLFWAEFEKINLPSSSIKRYIMSHSRIEGNNNLFEILKNKWNHPGTANSPDSFLGVIFDGNFDHDGNCIYFKMENFR